MIMGEEGGGEEGAGGDWSSGVDSAHCSCGNDPVSFSKWVSFRDAPCAYGLTRLAMVEYFCDAVWEVEAAAMSERL